MNFMHFHNSCTRNCDHHIFLIITANAHKESCHRLLLKLVKEQRLIKTDCSGKMKVSVTIKEKNYLMVNLFFVDAAGAAAFLFVFVVLSSQFGRAIGPVSGIATKATIVLFIFSLTNCYGYGFVLIFS